MIDRWDMMDGLNGASSLWMIVAMALIGVLVVISVWFIVRAGRSDRDVRQPRQAAMDILRRRLADGQISPEAFETARKALGAQGEGENGPP